MEGHPADAARYNWSDLTGSFVRRVNLDMGAGKHGKDEIG